jgi:hypothetical protein
VNPNKREYINRMRRLAAAFIVSADAFANAQTESVYAGYAFTEDDFAGSDITVEQFHTFVDTLAGLLGGLTVEQKQAIYAVKGSSMNIVAPPPTII